MINLIFDGFLEVMYDSLNALIPLLIILFFLHFLFLKLSIDMLIQIIKGILFAFFGLVLFLHGVNISFINTGYMTGEVLGTLKNNWIIVPIGFVLGFIVTFAEPAVKILNNEIEKITTGYINKRIVLMFLSLGVAFSVALSMVRILTGISLWYFLVPGYLIALILTKFVGPLFVAIAFDAGGVVTGPMIATFLLAVILGVSKFVEGSDPLIDGFGMIAMVSLMPIISILVLGLIYERSNNKEVYVDEK